MIRSFITLLLVAVFFLAGMLLGIDRGQSTDTLPEQKAEEIIVTDTDEMTQSEENDETTEKVSEVPMNADEPVHFTQKIASSLEMGIKWFYDIVVLIVYQIAQLFF